MLAHKFAISVVRCSLFLIVVSSDRDFTNISQDQSHPAI